MLTALSCIGSLAAGVGKPIRVHVRAVLPELLLCLGDGKQQVCTSPAPPLHNPCASPA